MGPTAPRHDSPWRYVVNPTPKHRRDSGQRSQHTTRRTPRSPAHDIAPIPERSLFLFEILIGLLGAHSIATIHGERNQHTRHNRKIKCEEAPDER